MVLVTPDRPPGGSRSDSGHILAVGQGWIPSVPKPRGKDPARNICWEYNTLAGVFGPPAGLGMSV